MRSSTVPRRHEASSATATERLLLRPSRRTRQPIRRVLSPVEQDVLDEIAKHGLDLVVDRELPGVDDAHVEAGLDGVIEKRRVHRLTDEVVPSEGERDVADPAADPGVGQGRLDLARRLDEGHGVVVVLLDSRRHRQDVGVEDQVLGREARLRRQQVVGASADGDLALAEAAWPSSSKAITTSAAPYRRTRRAFSRKASSPSLSESEFTMPLPWRQRSPPRSPPSSTSRSSRARGRCRAPQPTRFRNRVMACSESSSPSSMFTSMIWAPPSHLLAGHLHGLVVASFADETGEAYGAGDVGALADVDEVALGPQHQRIEARQVA